MDHGKGSILPDSFGAGPLGIGDPDDTHLRKLEKDVMIPALMRERLRTEICLSEWKEWGECGKRETWKSVFNCKKLLAEIKKCHTKMFYDPDFRAETEKLYLQYRSDYRQTGNGHPILRDRKFPMGPPKYRPREEKFQKS